jgi:hypothetical protein
LLLAVSASPAKDVPSDGFQAGTAACFDGGAQAASVAAVNSMLQSDGPDIWIAETPLRLDSSAYHDICDPCGLANPLHPASSGNLVLDTDISGPSGVFTRFERLAIGAFQAPTLAGSGIPQASASLADVFGNPRVQGAAIDRGAFERTPALPVFRDGFEQLKSLGR